MNPSSPDQNERFSSRSCLAVFRVTTNPRPSLPPLLEMLWLTIPMTSPFMLNMGPPEFPVLMTASVWKNSASGICVRRPARADVADAQRVAQAVRSAHDDHVVADLNRTRV